MMQECATTLCHYERCEAIPFLGGDCFVAPLLAMTTKC